MTQASFLFIPDISGFTEFVNETEISHSRHVISELLEVILRSDELGMTVSEIEGDAVLFFLPGRSPSLGEVVEQAERTFNAFHAHLKRYERDRICPCGACKTAHQLTLKIVAHSGPIETIKVQEFEKPYGADVILAHRLLKNDIPTQEYLLITEGLSDRGDELPSWAEPVQGSTTYENIGSGGPVESTTWSMTRTASTGPGPGINASSTETSWTSKPSKGISAQTGWCMEREFWGRHLSSIPRFTTSWRRLTGALEFAPRSTTSLNLSRDRSSRHCSAWLSQSNFPSSSKP